MPDLAPELCRELAESCFDATRELIAILDRLVIKRRTRMNLATMCGIASVVKLETFISCAKYAGSYYLLEITYTNE